MCKTCNDQHYTLLTCCSGYQCGCMGLPVQITNCKVCNPNKDKPLGEELASYEFIKYMEEV